MFVLISMLLPLHGEE